ncbi:MAG TPA: proton-conducting transporter membrane subunit [Salinisphaeraceae bacterium]|nr:proton-conducting transporter membrane subunit [Salinisphaeraceae bacterium]
MSLVAALVPLTIAIPLVVGAFLAAAGRHLPRVVVDGVALFAALAVTGAGATILYTLAAGRQALWSGGWQPHDGTSVGILLMADPVSAGLVVLAGVLTLAALVFSWRYFEAVESYFHALMLLFLAGLCGFALSGDLFNMFVFFELMGVAAYALTGFMAEQPHTVQGALNFGVVNSLGGYVVLLGIALIYAETGELGLAQVGERLRDAGAITGYAVVASFVLLSCGWLVKAAVAPFHFWSADAHAVAPTPVCVLFSGIMSQLGVYAIARTYWSVYAGILDAAAVSRTLLVFGAATALIGALMSYSQNNVKRLLAFSTIAHIGLYLMAVGLLRVSAFAGVGLFMLGDAAVKAALFLGTGVLLNRFETVAEDQLHGRGRGLWATRLVFILGGLIYAGLPPFATSAGKAVIEAAAGAAGLHSLIWCYVLTTAITGGAVLRTAGRIFFGWGRSAAGIAEEQEEDAETERGPLRRIPWTMIAPSIILLALALLLGIATMLGLDFAHAAAIFMDPKGYAAAALFGAPAVAESAVAVQVWTAQGFVTSVVTIVLALMLAAAGIWRRRLPRVPGWVLHPLLLALNALRGAHSGHLGDYVAWLMAGIAGFAALLILA